MKPFVKVLLKKLSSRMWSKIFFRKLNDWEVDIDIDINFKELID